MYEDEIRRTWDDAPEEDMDASHALQVCHAAMGVAEEFDEYTQSETLDELGDLEYYLTMLRNLLELDHGHYPYVQGVLPAADFGCRLMGLVKKHVFFDEDNLDEIEAQLQKLANFIACVLHTDLVIRNDDDPLEKLRELNLEKLKKRYPDGFDVR